MQNSEKSCNIEKHQMVETQAMVVGHDPVWAYLNAERKSGCASCSASKNCGTGALAAAFGDKGVNLRIRNDFDAKTGERIVIGLSEAVLLQASILAYMVPLGGLIGGAVLGGVLGYGEILSVICGGAGLGAGFLIAAKLRKPFDSRFQPVFLRRIGAF